MRSVPVIEEVLSIELNETVLRDAGYIVQHSIA